ncbi:hypothetical protein [Escherichia coli]|uniref:hypothetical protein n=1 Tax=Escherichia coli TaxID=562 RepID=UPI00244A0044|nr:hypothetical protein [Escherichia coli]
MALCILVCSSAAAPRKKTVTVQEIRASVHRTHSMSGYKTPLLNDFCGEPLKRRVRDYYSTPAIEIEEFETAYKGSPEEKHEFTSYY